MATLAVRFVMAVTILIPITHLRFTGGKKTVTVTADTIGEAIKRMFINFPDLERCVIEKGKALGTGMEIAVNDTPLFPFNPDLKINDGDTIRISSVITGG